MSQDGRCLCDQHTRHIVCGLVVPLEPLPPVLRSPKGKPDATRVRGLGDYRDRAARWRGYSRATIPSCIHKRTAARDIGPRHMQGPAPCVADHRSGFMTSVRIQAVLLCIDDLLNVV